MFAAFLTTLLFSVSGVTAKRSTRYLPSLEANFWRLLLATGMLALYGHTLGAGLGGPAFGWFLLSGFVGFGVGDIALYLAYPHLGSRLVILIVHCVASPLAAAIEWTWMGVPMTGREMVAGFLILSGVALALAPSTGAGLALGGLAAKLSSGRGRSIGFALIAAAGQGVGAVLSRRAFEVTRLAGHPVDGISAAYQRILAGVVVSAISLLWLRRWGAQGSVVPLGNKDGNDPAGEPVKSGMAKAFPWLVINALAGPALGVSCFQWALAERGTGVVLPIVALTPLAIIPLSVWLEGERPNRRSLAGAVVAVAGAVLHAVSHVRP